MTAALEAVAIYVGIMAGLSLIAFWWIKEKEKWIKEKEKHR